MASGHQEDHEAGLRSGDRRGRDDYCDDPRRRWKNSLRPLDPGILSDVKKKKKERSHSVASSVPVRSRSRSMSPGRAPGASNLAAASTVASRAKMRDAIRFEYKRPERKKFAPARRSQSLDRRRASLPPVQRKSLSPAPAPAPAPAPPKPARPSLSPSPAPARAAPRAASPVRARSASLPRKSASPAPAPRREPEKQDRTPMTWQAPRAESRSTSQHTQETSSFETQQFQEQIRQQRLMQQHARQMQESEQRRSQERQSRATERKTIVPIRSSQSEQVRQERQERQEETRREVREERKESRQEEQSAVSQTKTRRKKSTAKTEDVNIPVKNYRSQSLRAREPSPPVDYPDPGASEDTDENDVRIADYAANDKKSRRKSVQSYSKRTSVTRQYPGCVIA